MTDLSASLIRTLAARLPAVVPHLRGRARWIALAQGGEYKTYDYFLKELERMVSNVYGGNLGGEFIDIMASLIQGQLTQAFTQAWADEGGEGELPEYLTEPLTSMILGQYVHVDQFYRDIVDARVDQTPIGPLLARAGAWANRWNEAYNYAVRLITAQTGGKMQWVLGIAEHCDTCLALNGIVAFATEWEISGFQPQGSMLQCKGYNCKCSLIPTNARRSPKALDRLMRIARS